MRYSRHSVSLRTLGLAFTVALSPAFMNMEEVTCNGIGDTRLSTLEFEVAGENLVAFDTSQEVQVYEVMLPQGTESAILRAESVNENADVMYNLSVACPPPVEHGDLGVGGGEVTLEDLPFGHSTLTVYVHAPEGAAEAFTIHITQPMLCE